MHSILELTDGFGRKTVAKDDDVRLAWRNGLKNKGPILADGAITVPKMTATVFFIGVIIILDHIKHRIFLGPDINHDLAIFHRSWHLIINQSFQTNARLHFQCEMTGLPFFGCESHGVTIDNLARWQPSHELQQMSAGGKFGKDEDAVSLLLPFFRTHSFGKIRNQFS